MITVATNVLHNSSEAEDAAHDVFVSLGENIRVLDGMTTDRIRAYLYIAVRNAAIDIIKDKKKYAELDDELPSDIDDNAITDYIYNKDNYYLIISIIKDMDDKYSEVLYLRYVAGYSTPQIAQMLKRKPQTVNCQIFRGKKLLFEILSKGKNNGR